MAALVAGQGPPARFFIQVNTPGFPPYLLGPAPLPPSSSPSGASTSSLSETSSSEAGAVCTSLSTAYLVSTVVATTTQYGSAATSYATETVFVTSTAIETTASVSSSLTPAGLVPLNRNVAQGRRGMPKARDVSSCTSTTTLTTTVVSTATETSTVEADDSVTTTTITATSTVLQQPAASTESVVASNDITSTRTIVTTSFTTATETEQPEAPASTVYAQCSENNMLDVGYINGNPSGYQRVPVWADSAESCCLACAMTPNCAGSAYMQIYSTCENIIADTCAPNQPHFSYVLTNFEYYTLSNGACGRFFETV
ncbi:uncharacterized protein B0I36DRAFT_360870 [Microdochium trichocladiopsis]|uniref:Apple domain-containing protein n=1 Tax=Microdochium trichocladiopsis TaxID=1682393 RepID=A0A9P8YEJ1_9PEZI|nr:uncharacterized protein B0I36DRAFT_360870 [Microdochium trichocladiopsis]KAH7035517.1 hypothetical protein B0I36DRAFT_360870 [Microdochium trichocladiopsis]